MWLQSPITEWSLSVSESCEEEGPLTERAVISRVFARWTRAVVGVSTDAAHVVFWHVPSPGCDGLPGLDRDLHRRGMEVNRSRCSRDRYNTRRLCCAYLYLTDEGL